MLTCKDFLVGTLFGGFVIFTPINYLFDILLQLWMVPQLSSDKGFTGPVGALLSKVDKMDYNADFKAMSVGEKLIEIPEYVLDSMSTDQKLCYKLANALMTGKLPDAHSDKPKNIENATN